VLKIKDQSRLIPYLDIKEKERTPIFRACERN